MAVKTFTTGEVLTAADTNTYLNNGGLVYITQASVSSGSTFSIANCFTSTFANYRIVANNVTTNGTAAMAFQLMASGSPATTNYARQRLYVQNLTAAGQSSTGDSSVVFAYTYTNVPQYSIIDIFNPAATSSTVFTQNQIYRDNAGYPYIEIRNMYHSTAASYDGFRVTTTDTFSAGTFIVYGYRQA